MSSVTNYQEKHDLFNTYLVNQDEGNETEEKPAETPVEPTASWAYKAYMPQRASFHSIQGKIKRYFA